MKNNVYVKLARKFKQSSLLDDLKFRKLCESKEAVSEILQVILKDDKLQVLRCFKQKSEDEPLFHGVILDCECKLKSGEIVDVEIQNAINDDMAMRMRYNGSIMTVENTPKAKNFKYKGIPKIILIMICNFDLFNLGLPIYEIKRKVNDTDIIFENGQREIYVNVNADVKEKKLKDLLKILTTYDFENEKYFPNLTEKKKEIKSMKLGGDGMYLQGLSLEIYNDAKREGKKEGMKEGKKEILDILVKDGLLTKKEAKKRLHDSLNKFSNDYMDGVGKHGRVNRRVKD